MNAKPLDRLVISTWRINNEVLFNTVGYTKSNFEALSSTRSPFEFLEAKDDSTNKFIADFLANEFCRSVSEAESYLYNFTIAIAKVHLQNVKDNKFSGLFYPTVQLNADEENFAIKKETIDHGLLDFERAEFIEVVGKVGDRYKYKIIDVADGLEGESIVWKNLDHHWTVYDDSEDLYFEEKDGEIVAFNKDADIINPD